jgi:hypothetical protein
VSKTEAYETNASMNSRLDLERLSPSSDGVA